MIDSLVAEFAQAEHAVGTAGNMANATELLKDPPAEAFQAEAQHGNSQVHEDRHSHKLPSLCLDGPYDCPFTTCPEKAHADERPSDGATEYARLEK